MYPCLLEEKRKKGNTNHFKMPLLLT
uniref:Uncharacterized protein n=1 Tax=Rhizophora mucronata TaxID=61149 RepID=A0A2P2P205_RHIMU